MRMETFPTSTWVAGTTFQPPGRCNLTSMPASPTPPDQFEQTFAEMETPESKLKFEEDHRFLREVVYVGLRDLNTGFGSPQIGHVSPVDFLTVIDRCESLHVQVIGIEVFTTDVKPPWKVGFLEVEIYSEDGYEGARRLLERYQGKPDITVSATFGVP
jgi:hypothetical protein